MKILLIAGHGAGDSGAVGISGVKEADKTRELVKLVADKLRTYTSVDVRDINHNAFSDYKNGTFSAKGYDYVLELHFNAFNGQARGTEIFVTTMEKAVTVEQGLMEALGKYFPVRGVKVTDFSVIYTSKKQGASSALLETCFIDNLKDMQAYERKKKEIASAIANAIAKGFGLDGDKPSPVKPPKPSKPVNEPTLDQLAREVIKGMHGNGVANRGASIQRKYPSNTFTAQQIQERVNAILDRSTGHKPSVNIDAVARQVINGDFGNGQTRRQTLIACYGASIADQVQARVNQILQ
ncbi:MAG: N-acetylmuramoyl-L-alanine amidase [Breznakia sp.]